MLKTRVAVGVLWGLLFSLAFAAPVGAETEDTLEVPSVSASQRPLVDLAVSIVSGMGFVGLYSMSANHNPVTPEHFLQRLYSSNPVLSCAAYIAGGAIGAGWWWQRRARRARRQR
jgi:hypothetical protein